MKRIFIALGSSIGDAEALFDSTETFLKSHGVQVLQKSKNHIFPPYGGVAENDFTNAVWEIKLDRKNFSLIPEKQAHQLLSILQKCEKKHGRTRTKRWDDRTLDLDLLLFKRLCIQSKRLTVPHPEMHKRDFVLLPLQELL